MQTPRDRYYPEHQNHPRSLPSPVLRDRQAPSAQSGRLPGRRRGLGGAQLPQGAAWGTAPSPALPALRLRSSPGRCVPALAPLTRFLQLCASSPGGRRGVAGPLAILRLSQDGLQVHFIHAAPLGGQQLIQTELEDLTQLGWRKENGPVSSQHTPGTRALRSGSRPPGTALPWWPPAFPPHDREPPAPFRRRMMAELRGEK